MVKLIARRLGMSVALVFVASIVSFVMVSITPGNVVTALIGSEQQASQQDIARIESQLGLNKPLWERYWDWLQGAVHGDLGKSFLSGQSVTAALNSRLGVTVSIVVASLLLSVVIGVALGLASALRQGWLGKVTDILSLAGLAIPNFWLGLVLAAVFAVGLRWFPATGYVPLTADPGEWLRSIALPVLALFPAGVAVIAKQMRNAMLEVLDSDFIRNLRANGLSSKSIVLRHGLRNAAIPVVTVSGLVFVGLLGGTVFIEELFALPGLGRLVVSSVNSQDVFVVQGIVVYFTLIVVVVNLLIDLVYGWISPKARIT